MISDELCDAIQSIEDYQRDLGETYRDLAADIDLVKAVMRSLVDRLDDPFGDEQPRLRDFLSDDQKDMWRVTCEAYISRWA